MGLAPLYYSNIQFLPWGLYVLYCTVLHYH